MRSLVSVVVLVLLAAGCSSDGDSDSGGEPAPAVTVTQTVEVPTPTSDPTEAQEPTESEDPFAPNVGDRALKVGEPRVGSATTTTLLEVRDPYPSEYAREPDAGNRFVGIRVSQCVSEDFDPSVDGDIYSTYSGEWFMVTSDNDEYPGGSGSNWIDFPTPKFPESATINPGSCVKGWISMQAKERLQFEKLVWRPAGTTTAEWFLR